MDRVAHRPLFDRCWSMRANLTTYDAAYVALAEQSGFVLLTGNAKLASAPGLTCAVEVL